MYKITTSVLLVIVFLCNFCCAECVLKSDYDYFTECYNDGSCKFIRNIVEKLCEILSTDLVKLNYAKVDVQNFCKKDISINKTFIRVILNSEKYFNYNTCIEECSNSEYIGEVHPQCTAIKAFILLLLSGS